MVNAALVLKFSFLSQRSIRTYHAGWRSISVAKLDFVIHAKRGRSVGDTVPLGQNGDCAAPLKAAMIEHQCES
jgi:hypothetical protein